MTLQEKMMMSVPNIWPNGTPLGNFQSIGSVLRRKGGQLPSTMPNIMPVQNNDSINQGMMDYQRRLEDERRNMLARMIAAQSQPGGG